MSGQGAIVILGGGGFIGTALACRLAGEGRAVRVVSRRPRPAALPREVSYHRGPLDEKQCRKALRGAAWIVHLASESVPGTPYGPAGEGLAGVLPTLRLLEWLPEFPARLLFVSTGGAIYGNVAARRARENARLAPLSYYAAGKASLEAFISAYTHLNRRSTLVVRPSNVYGPGQPIRAGFGVVPTLLEAAASGRPFELLGAGATVRDFLYIDDFTDLCRRLLDAECAPGVTTLNAGSGRGHSVRELVGLVEQITGQPIRRVTRPARPGDVQRVVLNPREARRLTGWRIAVTLPEGLLRTWRWYSASRH